MTPTTDMLLIVFAVGFATGVVATLATLSLNAYLTSREDSKGEGRD